MKTLYAPTLYLIRGIPGSGKSTLARLFLHSDIVDIVVEADQYFMVDGEYKFDPNKLASAHEWCFNTTVAQLEVGSNVAVSNTFTTESELYRYLRYAEDHGVTVVSLIVENRHGNSSVHNVPEQTLKRMRSRFNVNL